MGYGDNEVYVPGNGFPTEVAIIEAWVLENNLQTVSSRGCSSRFDPITKESYEHMMVWNVDDETERLLFTLRWAA